MSPSAPDPPVPLTSSAASTIYAWPPVSISYQYDGTWIVWPHFNEGGKRSYTYNYIPMLDGLGNDSTLEEHIQDTYLDPSLNGENWTEEDTNIFSGLNASHAKKFYQRKFAAEVSYRFTTDPKLQRFRLHIPRDEKTYLWTLRRVEREAGERTAHLEALIYYGMTDFWEVVDERRGRTFTIGRRQDRFDAVSRSALDTRTAVGTAIPNAHILGGGGRDLVKEIRVEKKNELEAESTVSARSGEGGVASEIGAA